MPYERFRKVRFSHDIFTFFRLALSYYRPLKIFRQSIINLRLIAYMLHYRYAWLKFTEVSLGFSYYNSVCGLSTLV